MHDPEERKREGEIENVKVEKIEDEIHALPRHCSR